MTPADLLREVKRRLLAGPASKTWCRGTSLADACCLMNHIRYAAMDVNSTWGESAWIAQAKAQGVVDELAEDAGFDEEGPTHLRPGARFNDAQTSLWPILALINKAIARLEKAAP